MDDKIIATFCLCDDLLKAMHHQEDCQCQMNDAAIMTTALIAALFFRGNHESARAMLKQYGYIPQMLSKSRLSRRLHRMKDIFIVLFNLLAQIIRWYLRNRHRASIIQGLEILDILGKIHPTPPILRSTKGVSDGSTTTYQHGPQVPSRLRCRRTQ